MWMKHRIGLGSAAFVLGAASLVASVPASAGNSAGAFLGGVFATKILSNMDRQTRAEEYRASVAQPRYITAPPASAGASQSPEARLQQLDKLAAGGYITPAEYKAKKQQILNNM